MSQVGPFRDGLAEAVVLLDFDGTLAPIVARPEEARPVAGAGDVIAALVRRVAAVWIVTGRPSATIRELLGPIEGLRIAGLYGFEGAAAVPTSVLRDVESVAGTLPGAQVEEKGPSVAVHFRNADDPDAAGASLRPALGAVATRHGFRVLSGKRVWELVPAGAGGKGDVVGTILEERRPPAALYAGDDVADLEAFEALDRYAEGTDRSVFVRKIAVLGDETPVALREAADVVVEGPAGVIEMLRAL